MVCKIPPFQTEEAAAQENKQRGLPLNPKLRYVPTGPLGHTKHLEGIVASARLQWSLVLSLHVSHPDPQTTDGVEGMQQQNKNTPYWLKKRNLCMGKKTSLADL